MPWAEWQSNDTQGMPIHFLRKLLGHRNLGTTQQCLSGLVWGKNKPAGFSRSTSS
jgi:hypothetical protein